MELLIARRILTAAQPRRLIATLFLCGATSLALAQSVSHMRFTRMPSLVTDDPSIVSILQDRQGFIWLGALNGGLYRYDGGQAVKFLNDPKNEASLPGERVNTIFEDSAGAIWAGTTYGLARYNPGTNDFTRFVSDKKPGKHQVIRKIISDGKGGMWVGTWGGLQHFDPASGKFRLFQPKAGAPHAIRSDSVEALALDARGGLWIALYPSGLDYLDPVSGKFRHFNVDTPQQPDPVANKVEALAMDADQRLWIGTRRGVHRWTDGTPWENRVRLPSSDVRINNFYPARDGGMWAVTMNDGVLRWSAGADEPRNYGYRPNDPYSLPTLSFQSVMQDRSGLLWVGSYNAGVVVANPASKGFTRLIPPEFPFGRRQPNNTTVTIAGAPDGRIWIGGLTGVSLMDPATGNIDKYYRAQAGRPGALGADTVISLYQDPAGPLWTGTTNGLFRLDPASEQFTPIPFPNTNNSITAIRPGAGARLWITTNASVIHYDPAAGTHRIYTLEKDNPNSRRMARANTVLEDRQGRVWMGSEYADGLDMLDTRTGKFRHFVHDDRDPGSMSSNFIVALHEDVNGRIWAGTAQGLNEIVTGADGKISFRAYPGAGSEKVFAIQGDALGNVWLTTLSSLLQLDPATGKTVRYTSADGLLEGYRVGAAYADAAGKLYFAGGHGVLSVDPRAVQVDASAPAVSITDVSVLNRSLALKPRPEGVQLTGPVTAPRKLVLAAHHSVLSLEFSALHFADPASNRYSYKLEGFDKNWVGADAAHRRATYTNLDPGNYVFKVKAANHRGQWSEQEATLAIEVLPPFWKTWWFRIGAAILAVSLLGIAYRVRVGSLTRSKQRLQSEVAARTAELAESNAKLEALSLTDGLTALTNRRGFDAGLADEWARACRSGQTVALAMLDVDHFKLYNDKYGHQAGDRCLQAIAEVIAAHARRPGDIAARYGGEEFALLTPATEGGAAAAIAKAICERVAALQLPHADSSYGIVTVSIGIGALVPGADNSPELLIRLADDALYRAKHEGRSRAVLATAADEELARQNLSAMA
ncbi:diguanylate cyclase [Massilia sp. PAMC28688]|uniref:ligand-binding sensor domain-containing diguanylate cyclase n=1 Tax=Massilia sp. PAMC28688 TaxID=2861283 RepID=UPI001C633379|nr:diguanylate cyclase [Massilia sp. PAMC28688]QYF93678.1 diguanylate cyclase [Massilia sp. PAMC28688]